MARFESAEFCLAIRLVDAVFAVTSELDEVGLIESLEWEIFFYIIEFPLVRLDILYNDYRVYLHCRSISGRVPDLISVVGIFDQRGMITNIFEAIGPRDPL